MTHESAHQTAEQLAEAFMFLGLTGLCFTMLLCFILAVAVVPLVWYPGLILIGNVVTLGVTYGVSQN